ncbi:MAG TPA: hypothetical protein VGB48_07940 [Allosphingosinicella sp.]
MRFLAGLALLTGCGGPDAPAGGNQWRYSLAVPVDFKPEQVQGIDSAVARYRGPGAVLSLDHGMYGGAPTCSGTGCELVEEQLDGHRAVIGRFRFRPAEQQGRGPFFVHVYVQLRRQPLEEGLEMRASCESQEACDRALAIFRTVLFERA